MINSKVTKLFVGVGVCLCRCCVLKPAGFIVLLRGVPSVYTYGRGSQRWTVAVISWVLAAHHSLRQAISLAWNSLRRQAIWSHEPRDPCPCLPRTGITSVQHHTSCVRGQQWTQLRCSQGKHFTDSTASSTLTYNSWRYDKYSLIGYSHTPVLQTAVKRTNNRELYISRASHFKLHCWYVRHVK